jgi:hypothetical protein
MPLLSRELTRVAVTRQAYESPLSDLDRGSKIIGWIYSRSPVLIESLVDGDIEESQITVAKGAVASARVRAEFVIIWGLSEWRYLRERPHRDSQHRQGVRQYHSAKTCVGGRRGF